MGTQSGGIPTNPGGQTCGMIVMRLKLAVTLAAATIETVQDPIPAHAPDQPVKLEPEAGVAVSVTVVPLLYVAAHVIPQLIPEGDDVIVPAPVPARAVVSEYVFTLNVAVTAVAAVTVVVHVPTPEHAPDHPVKVDPASAVAVSVTRVL